jgi:hypothetical protein
METATKLKDKYFLVEYGSEHVATMQMIEKIRDSGWVSAGITIVNCFPEYSARAAQLANHRLSHFNGNELFEQVDLQMPYPNMSQVWNNCDRAYQTFSKYLSDWVRLNIHTGDKYLFISAAENLNPIRNFVKLKLEPNDYRMATTYVKEGDPEPDFWMEKYQKPLLFQWENMDNPNW